MQRLEVADRTKSVFTELVYKSKAIQYARELEVQGDIPNLFRSMSVFFDLDRLWYQREIAHLVVQSVLDVAKQLDRKSNFDTIVSIVGNIGSFGPTPFSVYLSLELKKNLVILNEIDFGNLGIFPLTIAHEDLFSNKRVLILKDIIYHATSVQRAARLISRYGGQTVALLTLVDKKPLNRRYNFEDLQEAWYGVLMEPENMEFE
jgi:orotate phosphoribosyltransferase